MESLKPPTYSEVPWGEKTLHLSVGSRELPDRSLERPDLIPN